MPFDLVTLALGIKDINFKDDKKQKICTMSSQWVIVSPFCSYLEVSLEEERLMKLESLPVRTPSEKNLKQSHVLMKI